MRGKAHLLSTIEQREIRISESKSGDSHQMGNCTLAGAGRAGGGQPICRIVCRWELGDYVSSTADPMPLINDVFMYLHQRKSDVDVSMICTDDSHRHG